MIHGNIPTFDYRVAQTVACAENKWALILAGRLDGACGLPNGHGENHNHIRLISMRAVNGNEQVGIFCVGDECALSEMIEDLQRRGGYRAVVLDPSGEVDESYLL